MKDYKKIKENVKNIFLFTFSLALCGQVFTWGTALMNKPYNLLFLLGCFLSILSIGGVSFILSAFYHLYKEKIFNWIKK